MTEINYNELADAIAKRMQQLPAPEVVLWSAKQCAEYLHVSETHFMNRIAKGVTFPKPIKLPSETGKRAHSRWYAAEVIEWVKAHRQAG